MALPISTPLTTGRCSCVSCFRGILAVANSPFSWSTLWSIYQITPSMPWQGSCSQRSSNSVRVSSTIYS